MCYVYVPDVEPLDVLCVGHEVPGEADAGGAGTETFELQPSQEFGQRATLAPDWLFENKEPIKS